MIPLDQAVVARLESHGERFEILVDPDLAQAIREGGDIDVEDAVAARYVYENAAHVEKASDEALTKVFQTTEFEEVARAIIEKGEIHLTSEQRKQRSEDKRRQVITYIARNAINPQTNLPHPPQRIELALEEVRINFDPFKSVEALVKETVRALRPVLPIKFAERKFAVKIPPDHAPRGYGEIAGSPMVTMEREEWQADGSWICLVKIPAGMQEEFFSLVNRISKGDAEVRIIE
ncbi:MAG: ribosome assembly factor SBDS [Methanocalculus sp. MSAO_Arc1]|uniref:ribosome assembly factor SBDS n=1 Tax=Methanocalculus TaxID=71151 RepID=UPI000FF6932D|nr:MULTISPECIES: ribosome assembly factor SBDS [unclassified Methanocalculus]MCP1663122.1 ribosome maturation protein SDO1 [Methanocalculus sp. AMF5]RQD81584.1 MAG: ribosome assembly factor SBDS [Methanocalculus sp. MSAO_Arc1]